MKALLAKKLGMTTVFQNDGTAVPVTVLQAGPCTVSFVRPLGPSTHSIYSGSPRVNRGATSSGQERVNVQLGFKAAKEKHLTKPERGHLKELPLVRTLREFRLPAGEQAPQRGDTVDVSTFAVGDAIQVSGFSKGRGFQGVVKRHHFGGGPKSHGHKHNLRAPGSIGSRFPQHTRKGTRMAGRMGGSQVTVTGLTVMDVVPDEHLLVVKGAIPGARGALVAIEGVSP